MLSSAYGRVPDPRPFAAPIRPAAPCGLPVPPRSGMGMTVGRVYHQRSMRSVGFCPFCRDAFEDSDTCPEHGLMLVDFAQLPAPSEPEAGDAWLALGVSHRRGWVALGAALTLLAFLFPLAHLTGQVTGSNTLWEVASHQGKTLWAAGAAALGQLTLLYRRRTPDGLRAVRVVALLFALAPPVVVWVVARGVLQAAELMSVRIGGVEARVGLGVWLVLAATVPAVWGALRLGTPVRRAYRVELAPD